MGDRFLEIIGCDTVWLTKYQIKGFYLSLNVWKISDLDKASLKARERKGGKKEKSSVVWTITSSGNYHFSYTDTDVIIDKPTMYSAKQRFFPLISWQFSVL